MQMRYVPKAHSFFFEKPENVCHKVICSRCVSYAQVTHSRTGRRISHGYNPTSFVAIRIGPLLSVLHP